LLIFIKNLQNLLNFIKLSCVSIKVIRCGVINYDKFIKKCYRGGVNPAPSKGFTLAEVLITLGIIGVVAAMTMPVLFANINDVVLENQVKKAKSVLINGVKLLMAQDDVTNLDQTTLANCDDNECIKTEIRKAFKIVEEFDSSKMAKYTINDKADEDIWSDSDIIYRFATADGTCYGVRRFDKGADSLIFVADINGTKRPNTSCKDLLTFTVSGNSIAEGCDFASGCSVDNISACNENECRAMEGSLCQKRRGVVFWDSYGSSCICNTDES
jgi:prepilin-type N-terminal cleavage/methylation domain-containing protein